MPLVRLIPPPQDSTSYVFPDFIAMPSETPHLRAHMEAQPGPVIASFLAMSIGPKEGCAGTLSICKINWHLSNY